MALLDLRQAAHGCVEGIQRSRGGFGQLDLDESGVGQAQLRRVEDCPVAAYDAGRFQTLHACEARRFGKPDAAGQFRHAETPVDRQLAENFRVDAVYWTIRHDSVRRFDQNRNKKSLIYGSELAVKSKRLKNLCETDPVSMQR